MLGQQLLLYCILQGKPRVRNTAGLLLGQVRWLPKGLFGWQSSVPGSQAPGKALTTVRSQIILPCLSLCNRNT